MTAKLAPWFAWFLLPLLGCSTAPPQVKESGDECAVYAKRLSELSRLDDDGKKLEHPESVPALIQAFRFETARESDYKALQTAVVKKLPALSEEDYLSLVFGRAACHPVLGEFAAVRGLLVGVAAKQIDGDDRRKAIALATDYLKRVLPQPGVLIETAIQIALFEKLLAVEPPGFFKGLREKAKALVKEEEKVRDEIRARTPPAEKWPADREAFTRLPLEEKHKLMEAFRREIQSIEKLRQKLRALTANTVLRTEG